MDNIFSKYIVVVPVLNPSPILIDVVDELINVGFLKIVIVNDGSSDGHEIFRGLAKREKIDVLDHYVNLGKGRALKTAINYILNTYNDFKGIITVDADGQHKVNDVRKCVENLDKHSADRVMVLGCRSFGKKEQVKIPFRSKLGNVCTRLVLRYLCNIHISDTQTGLRGIPKKIMPDVLQVIGERYEYEMNMLLNMAELGVELIEIPIETIYENENATSHFNPLRDSLRIYMTILKYSFASIISVILDNAFFIIGGTYTNNVWFLTFGGRLISAIINFTMNKQLVFKKEGDWFKCAIKYLGLVIFSGTISAICVQGIYSLLTVNIIIIKLLVETILFFLNFYFQKNVVFRKE